MRTAQVPTELRDRPFTTAQAASYGVSRSALRATVWRHVFRDVWAHVDVPDSRELRLAAVRLILDDDHFICGPTTAWVYGIDVQDHRNELIWVGSATGTKTRTRPGCMVREITVSDNDLCVVNGVRMTTPLRTVFDCARWLRLVEAVVVADAITHSGAVSAADLAAYAAAHRGLRGVRQVDQVLDLVEPDTESPMETRVRLLIVLAGLPRPKPQLIVTDTFGRFVARTDLGYAVERVIVEYDGALHWEQRRADDRRRDVIRELGWYVLVVSAADYYETPNAIIAKVRHQLAKRAA